MKLMEKLSIMATELSGKWSDIVSALGVADIRAAVGSDKWVEYGWAQLIVGLGEKYWAEIRPTAEEYARGIGPCPDDYGYPNAWGRMVRRWWILRPDCRPSPAQYEAGVLDTEASEYWALRHDLVPPRELWESLLTHENWVVVSEWLAHPGIAVSAEQYERGLTDPCEYKRSSWAQRVEPTTQEQYERGLADHDSLVRAAWAGRQDLRPTPEQYERGLTDEGSRVREAWARRTDLHPNKMQYARGVADPDKFVRLAWAERYDLRPSPRQLVRGCDDPDHNTRRAWLIRRDDNINVPRLSRWG